jgi:prepilin-type N-terminal cleavage/methylation domain-containing protein
MARNSKSSFKSAGRYGSAGFSLIELLIVIAIILIVFAISIPSLLHARMAANQASATANVRTITTANVTYSSTYGNGYAGSLGTLGGVDGTTLGTCNAAVLIDSVLSNNGVGNNALKSGYAYTYVPGNALANPPPGCLAGADSYTLEADPQVYQVTGMGRLFVDSSGVIRITTDGSQPTSTSSPL